GAAGGGGGRGAAMSVWDVPWVELTIALPLAGVWLGRFRDPIRAFRWGMAFTGATLACALMAWLAFAAGVAPGDGWDAQTYLFGALLVLGWAFVDPAADHRTQTAWAAVPLLAAILIRCGAVPAHCWLTDWFEHASFGNGLLFVCPLTGVYAAVRLVLPVAPDW